ncbi:hypothetical protein T02_5167 [Trichinella nativa]|uniref:Uncharacterized protein n=1 Tax=Trichinella nativa TaxID=6335 RepID=A0A0V1L5B8_9BILA|nr:hypothetical protein T02_5167 [Trichinella nativa]
MDINRRLQRAGRSSMVNLKSGSFLVCLAVGHWPEERAREREGEKNNSSHPLSYDYLYGLGKQQRQWHRSFVDGVHSLHCSLVEHRRDIRLPSSSCTLFRTAQLPTAKLRCLEEEKF